MLIPVLTSSSATVQEVGVASLMSATTTGTSSTIGTSSEARSLFWEVRRRARHSPPASQFTGAVLGLMHGMRAVPCKKKNTPKTNNDNQYHEGVLNLTRWISVRLCFCNNTAALGV